MVVFGREVSSEINKNKETSVFTASAMLLQSSKTLRSAQCFYKLENRKLITLLS